LVLFLEKSDCMEICLGASISFISRNDKEQTRSFQHQSLLRGSLLILRKHVIYWKFFKYCLFTLFLEPSISLYYWCLLYFKWNYSNPSFQYYWYGWSLSSNQINRSLRFYLGTISHYLGWYKLNLYCFGSCYRPLSS